MIVEVWSDVVCPWCYIGKRRLEAALAEFPHRDAVEVVWRAYELDPSAPPVREGPYPARLAAKYGVAEAEAEAMVERMTAAAAGDGLDYRFDLARPGNTFDAHRLAHLAAERGRSEELHERLFAATFTQGRAIGDREVLVDLAAEAGLDAHEAGAVLGSDAYAEAVRAEEREGVAMGVRGVPFFLVDRTYGIGGAQPPEVLLNLLDRAWSETHRPVRPAR